jgi:hypothetical protein
VGNDEGCQEGRNRVEQDCVPWILGRLTSFASFLNSSSETSINCVLCVRVYVCVMAAGDNFRIVLRCNRAVQYT